MKLNFIAICVVPSEWWTLQTSAWISEDAINVHPSSSFTHEEEIHRTKKNWNDLQPNSGHASGHVHTVYIYMACTQVHHQFKTLCWPTINQRTDVHSPKKLETPPLKNMIDPSGSGSAPRNKYIVHIKKKKTSRRAVSFARYIKSTFRACEAHRVWWTQTCFVWMLTNQTI